MSKNPRGKKKKTLKLPNPLLSSNLKILSNLELEQSINYKDCSPIFSLKYYDKSHRKFSAKRITQCNDFHLLFAHLKKLGHLTWRDIEHGKFHAHPVTWKNTKQNKFPIILGDDINRFPPYQFQVFDRFRIFGFHLMGVFYIVWFDRYHEVDS